jgi:cellulose synthase (UDP-forming)
MAAALSSPTAPGVVRVVAPKSATSLRREIFFTRLVIAISLVASTLAMIALSRIVIGRVDGSQLLVAAIDGFFAINIAFLMYGSLFYQVTRHAYLMRMKEHRRASREELESIYDRDAHPLSVLVPSYCEELRVVRMTLMSAALMEYPDRNVVLLIDNPPNPTDPLAARELHATRDLTRKLDAMFRAQERHYAAELAAFERRRFRGEIKFSAEGDHLGVLYRQIAAWLEKQADAHELVDHYDSIFVRRVLLEPAAAHRERAAEIEELSRTWSGDAATARVAREYRRLAALFAVHLSSFERKRFENLPHASNKAMNLNAYLGLIEKNFREVIGPGGLHLEECEREHADLRIRGADYIVTLDADSMLLHDYALRLTHVMDQPGAERLGLVESPFTAVPGASSVLERIAGAQTDVQWYGSQGSTRYNGSFWVGANALLRRAALEDIRETIYERGHAISRYLQDRTLVEDTESTIDLVARGWKIFCYPERLSYSATPPDFGALVIQRRRWANGTVLIIPKLLRYWFEGAGRIARLPEITLRLYTLSSVLGAISMLLVTACRFPDARLLPVAWLMLATVPYHFLYGRDLLEAGYQWWDLARVYAMNLLLIPVNLAGLVRSLIQAATGRHPVFARTPKIQGRTAAPPVHIVMPALILLCVLVSTVHLVDRGGWAYAAYGTLNVVCLTYAISIFIGIRAGLEDLGANAALWKTALGQRLLFATRAAVIALESPAGPAREIPEPVATEATR